MTRTRAILFDLDDTLFPYHAFVRSGFQTVGRRLADDYGLSARAVVQALRAAWTNGERGREVQALLARFSLPATLVPALVTLIREHTPTLGLPIESMRVLRSLRPGWKIGVVTNGTPAIQRRKIAALGLSALVDDVVCATEYGDGSGKPAADAFRAALGRLRTAPETAVFVGNDADADVAGAIGAGLNAIHLVATPGNCPRNADCRGRHVRRLRDVPALASQLVSVRTVRHGL